ncbi:hypothetical protein SEA_CLUBPENGUIN_66 [Streptomyces phage ClubPenguin]|nr:hypothetical protein SEA_CLUBPENGUIN_66 [Streptomyces phage ClubPenguin]
MRASTRSLSQNSGTRTIRGPGSHILRPSLAVRKRGIAMIVPIVNKIKGQDQTIGTARILPDGGDVEFYLKPGFSLSAEVTKQLTKQLKRLVK